MTASEVINQLRTVYSSNRFEFEMNCATYLAGDHRKQLRQDIVLQLTGEKIPVSKCGLHRVSDALKNSFDQITLFQ